MYSTDSTKQSKMTELQLPRLVKVPFTYIINGIDVGLGKDELLQRPAVSVPRSLVYCHVAMLYSPEIYDINVSFLQRSTVNTQIILTKCFGRPYHKTKVCLPLWALPPKVQGSYE